MTLDRRTFLRGAGAALALPLLDAMRWPVWAGEGDERPLRLVYLYVPNGVHMPAWTPPAEGPLETLPPLLRPLQAHREQLLLLSGLAVDGARAHGDGPGDHARALAAYLTGVHPRKTAGADIQVGVSADQVAARHLAPHTRFPSLELGCEPSRAGGSCDSGYSCAYTSNISWRTPSQPLAKEIDPRAVFDRLFRPDADLDPAERARRQARRQSVLDLASDEARRLRARLGGADRRKLEEYLDAVREVEARLERSRAEEEAPPPELDLPQGVPSDPGEHIRALFDVLTLALQTDATRVVTLPFGNEGSNRAYRNLDIRDGHHHLSHHGGDPVKLEKIQRINHFHVEQLAYFLDQLASKREGAGTLLDRTLIVYGSGIGDGNRHNHDELPILLAGGADVIGGGRHVRHERQTPLANLHLALLRLLGAPVSRFGDSTAPLPGLAAPRPRPRSF